MVYETISSIEDNHSDIMICDYEHEASNMKVDAFELISDDTLILYFVDYSVVEESLSSQNIEEYVNKITNFVVCVLTTVCESGNMDLQR